MNKIITLLRALRPAERRGFQEWYLRDYASRDAATRATPTIVNVSHIGADQEDPRFDIVVETWVGDASTLAVSDDELQREAAEVYRYQVEELVERRKLDSVPGQATAGIKVVGCVSPVAGMERAETRRFWNQHVPLALDIHVGVANYTRNWVQADLTQRNPPYFGFPLLHFATQEDFRDRYFASPEAKVAHGNDVRQFVGGVDKLLTVEHVLPGSARSTLTD